MKQVLLNKTTPLIYYTSATPRKPVESMFFSLSLPYMTAMLFTEPKISVPQGKACLPAFMTLKFGVSLFSLTS